MRVVCSSSRSFPPKLTCLSYPPLLPPFRISFSCPQLTDDAFPIILYELPTFASSFIIFIKKKCVHPSPPQKKRIPQDPVLFSGSVRTNLDPFNEYADERLYEVLSRVGLYGTMERISSGVSLTSSMSGGGGGGKRSQGVRYLTDIVLEGGSNFSVGQRQLLVIARALLRGAKIVVMDEATASVDADTDARIQRVMKTDFRDSTCLTVAHRINTVMDSDRILVMDDGRVAEFDAPGTLLARGGLFRDLVDAWEKEHEGGD